MLFRVFLYFLNILTIIFLMGCSCFIYSKQDKKINDFLFFKRNSFYYLKKIWESPIDYKFRKYSNVNFSWFCQNSEIFLVDYYGFITKIDFNNGQILWSIDLSHVIQFKLYNFPLLFFGNVLSAGNKIFIVTENAEIYAICVNTGSIVWQTKLIDDILSISPVIIDGIILIYSDSGMLRGLNKDDGSIRWTLAFDIPLFTLKNKSIAVIPSYGIVLFGDDFGIINAVSIDHGKLLWKKRLMELRSNCSQVISRFNGVKIFTTNIDHLVCVQNYGSTSIAVLDICSRSVTWLYEVGSIKHIIFNSNVLCLVDHNNQLVAVDLFTGKILWKKAFLLNKNFTHPVLYNNHLILGDNKGYAYIIKIDNGNLVYRKKIIPFGILHDPIVIDNKLFIQSVNSIIYSFYIFI